MDDVSTIAETVVTDEYLTGRIAEGDYRSLQILFKRYGDWVQQLFFKFLEDAQTAEALYRNPFLELYYLGESGKNVTNVRDWLYVTTQNLSLLYRLDPPKGILHELGEFAKFYQKQFPRKIPIGYHIWNESLSSILSTRAQKQPWELIWGLQGEGGSYLQQGMVALPNIPFESIEKENEQEDEMYDLVIQLLGNLNAKIEELTAVLKYRLDLLDNQDHNQQLNEQDS